MFLVSTMMFVNQHAKSHRASFPLRTLLTFYESSDGKDFMNGVKELGIVDLFLKDWDELMSVDGVKTIPDVEFQIPTRGSPLFFDPFQGRVAASTRAEVRCVWKLGIVNGFEHHSDRLFHDLFYRYNHCKRSKLRPLFLSSYCKEEQNFFFCSLY